MSFGTEHGSLMFEIPVYRTSPDGWVREVEESVTRHEAPYVDLIPNRVELRNRAAYFAQLERGYTSAAYNQIIAWLRVVWDGPGPVVKCYAYRTPQRRIHRHFKPGRYESTGKVFERWFTDSSLSEEIHAELRTELVALSDRKGEFRGRHIDMDAFDSLAPHLNWAAAIGLRR